MANSRFGSDILQLQPQFHKVPLRVAEGVFLGSYTLVGVRAADGLAEEADAEGAYNRVYAAYQEFQAPETEEGWAKYETVDNVVLKLHQNGTISQENVGDLVTLVDAVTVELDGEGAVVGEVTEYISDDFVRVHIKSFN